MDSAFGWLRSRLLHGTHFLSDTGTLRLLHGTHFHSVGGTLDFKARTVYSAFCRWLSQFLHSVDTLDFFTASALLIHSRHARWFLYSIGGTLDLFMAHAIALDFLHGTCDGFCIPSAALSICSWHMRLLSTFFTARAMVSAFYRRHFDLFTAYEIAFNFFTERPLYYTLDQWRSQLILTTGALNLFTAHAIALDFTTAQPLYYTFDQWRTQLLLTTGALNFFTANAIALDFIAA
ncbi:hypothetical protein VE00_06460 [Pseudogymnoascus sp. WSF 3629]|nr:hypothetical protein VE00_06460 [Pseudogymnoascus sp. WSF 3629]